MILLSIAPLSGCNWFTNWVRVKDYKPLIVLPKRPKLAKMPADDLKNLKPATLQALKVRDAKLKDAIERHRDVIEIYNKWAAEQNEKSGFGKTTVIKPPDGD